MDHSRDIAVECENTISLVIRQLGQAVGFGNQQYEVKEAATKALLDAKQRIQEYIRLRNQKVK